MRSPGAAIAWEFRQRHRWGLIALALYLLVLAVLRLFSVDLSRAETFAFVVLVPLSSGFIYFLAAFSFGLDGDLAARQSIYPPRMFALPLTTNALAGWPMLYGAAAVTTLWFAARFVGPWPAGLHAPVVWPGLLGASLLAWTQALTWMPYPLRGLRVIVTVIWLVSIDTVTLLALQSGLPEPLMLAILAPHIPLAFITARFALRLARRGDVPDWSAILARRERTTRRADFQSPHSAQAWFEWRSHGRSLPAFVLILLPFELAMLFLFRQTPGIFFEMLGCVLLTPPFMAVFAAVTASKPAAPFITTRPMTSASLVAAKLHVAMISALVAWLPVVIAVPLALKFSGTMPLVLDKARDTIGLLGTARAAAVALLAVALLIAATWKNLVQTLYIGLTGREWLAKAAVLTALVLLAMIGPVAQWIAGTEGAVALLVEAFPWIAAALVLAKLAAAGWIAIRLRDHDLLSGRALIAGAACWDILVFALLGLLVWIFPLLLVRHYVLALIAILEVPLARLAAAPLALEWSRHR